MPTDRTLANAEQEWITKYRAAVDRVPTKTSKFARVEAFIRGVTQATIFKMGKPTLRFPARPPISPASKVAAPEGRDDRLPETHEPALEDKLISSI